MNHTRTSQNCTHTHTHSASADAAGREVLATGGFSVALPPPPPDTAAMDEVGIVLYCIVLMSVCVCVLMCGMHVYVCMCIRR